MFGALFGQIAGHLRNNPPVPAAGENYQDMIRQEIESRAPREQSRWAQALGAAGATLQDIGANNDGRAGGHLDRFTAAQERMRAARDDSRRRQLRFEHLRDTVPASDRQFWQAYALGGEEAALSALQSRHSQANETHTLAPGEQLIRGGETIAENTNRRGQEPAIIGSMRAAGIDPASDEGRSMIIRHYAEGTSPSVARIAADLIAKYQSGEAFTEAEQAAWDRIIEYRRAPDWEAAMLGGVFGGYGTPAPIPPDNDPLGWR